MAQAGETTARVDSTLRIGLESGLTLEHMESSAGQRVTIQTIAKNRNAVRRALGL